MLEVLKIFTYLAFAGLFVILGLGILNLARTDPEQASRSNRLMRMRVIAQFVCVILILLVALAAGKLF